MQGVTLAKRLVKGPFEANSVRAAIQSGVQTGWAAFNVVRQGKSSVFVIGPADFVMEANELLRPLHETEEIQK